MSTRHRTRLVIERVTLTLFSFTAFAGGVTYSSATVVGALGQVGYIDVHQASGAACVSGSTDQVCIGRPTAPNTAPSNKYTQVALFTRQVSGTGINTKVVSNVPPPIEVANLPRKTSLPVNRPLVTNFAQDVQVGLLGVFR